MQCQGAVFLTIFIQLTRVMSVDYFMLTIDFEQVASNFGKISKKNPEFDIDNKLNFIVLININQILKF